MRSVMKHDFSVAPQVDQPRSTFDRSFGYKTVFDAGQLIPFYVDDVLPGDTFTLNTTGFARLNTPAVPLMDNMYLDTHFFFIPLRLVWENSKKFFGEQDNPGDSIDYTIPQFASFTPAENSLSDYLGLPLGNAMTVNSIYHRGYNLVWNEYFRSQELQDSVVVDTDDGPDAIADYVLLNRGKRHDYFTSALTAPQRGDAVNLPLGTTAPILGLGKGNQTYNSGSVNVYETEGTGTTNYAAGALITDTGVNNYLYVEQDPNNTGFPGIYADLTNATASTVNDIREAFQIQKLLERDARGGTRYSELVNNHFGVNFYDLSYRPQFLGGGSTPVIINPVTQTNHHTVQDLWTGDLGATGTAAFTHHGFTSSFHEHGFILGLASVRADLTYQQGIPRHFLKQTRYDIFWPSLAMLGEQSITNAEIYYQNTAADENVFGYQERYAEYRYKPSQITGTLRSTAATPLDIWHLSQEFSALPTLGDTFIKENPPIDRVVRTSSEPHFVFDSYTHLRCARPMPVHSVPGMIDHF